jgi:hypothetical protein
MMQIGQKGYSDTQVLAILKGHSGSRRICFRYDLLDKEENKIGELDCIESGEVSFNAQNDIKRTAKFHMRDRGEVDWLNDRIQPFILVGLPDGDWLEFPQGIFMLSSPLRKDMGKNIYRNVDAYDTSLILKNDKLTSRCSVEAGVSYQYAVERILRSANIKKISMEPCNKVLDRDIEWEIGTEKRKLVNQLLDAINYTSLWVDENGYFCSSRYIPPNEREVDIFYSDDEFSVIHNGVEEDVDVFNIPNVWVVVASNPEINSPLISLYENANPNSPTSILNRDMRIVDYRTITDIADQNTLDNYTKMLAFSGSQAYGHVRFTSAIMPIHGYVNILGLKYNILGIDDRYTEMSWTIQMQPGGIMKHEARRIIQV